MRTSNIESFSPAGTAFNGVSAEVEYQAGVDLPLLDLLEGRVDLVQSPGLADDAGAALAVELEGLGQIDAGADDGPGDGDALQHGLEYGQTDEVVRGKTDEDQRPAAFEAPECLFARGRGDGQDDGLVGSAQGLYRLGGILGRGVDGVLGAEFLGQSQFGVHDIDRGDRGARDIGVLDGQMPEAADAEDGDEIRGSSTRYLDRLVGGHPGTGQRCGVEGIDARG